MTVMTAQASTRRRRRRRYELSQWRPRWGQPLQARLVPEVRALQKLSGRSRQQQEQKGAAVRAPHPALKTAPTRQSPRSVGPPEPWKSHPSVTRLPDERRRQGRSNKRVVPWRRTCSAATTSFKRYATFLQTEPSKWPWQPSRQGRQKLSDSGSAPRRGLGAGARNSNQGDGQAGLRASNKEGEMPSLSNSGDGEGGPSPLADNAEPTWFWHECLGCCCAALKQPLRRGGEECRCGAARLYIHLTSVAHRVGHGDHHRHCDGPSLSQSALGSGAHCLSQVGCRGGSAGAAQRYAPPRGARGMGIPQESPRYL